MNARVRANRTSSAVSGLLFTLTLFAPTAASAQSDHGPQHTARQQSEGIWKAAVPPGRMKGQFASHDPIGLAAGALIKADCSINWRHPDTGKLYCFSSGTSLVSFLSWPNANIKRASKGWVRLSKSDAP